MDLFLHQGIKVSLLMFRVSVVVDLRRVGFGCCMWLICEDLSWELVVFKAVAWMERHFFSAPSDGRGLKVHFHTNAFHTLSSNHKLVSHLAVDHKTLNCFAFLRERQFREHGLVQMHTFCTAVNSISCPHSDGIFQSEQFSVLW